jgi:hypothetical protein
VRTIELSKERISRTQRQGQKNSAQPVTVLPQASWVTKKPENTLNISPSIQSSGAESVQAHRLYELTSTQGIGPATSGSASPSGPEIQESLM